MIRSTPVGVPITVLATVLVTVLVAAILGACSGGEDAEGPAATPSRSGATSAPATATAKAAPRAKRPTAGSCHRLDYAEAVAPTSDAAPVRCAGRHTTRTIAVGELDAVAWGHLLAVDSDRVRRQVADACPRRFASYVGGTVEDRRLSMLRTVWFTPTVAQSDLGASWYRCDVLAIAGDERLAPLTGRLRGVLDRDEGRRRYGMCGTAAPGTPSFERVICAAKHTWRAVAVVPFDQRAYPGVGAARAAGDQPCQNAGAAAADGALGYEWGYEWPSAKQWRRGQRYGICWAPDRS